MESEKCEKNEYGIGAVITCLDTVKFLSFFPVEENFELFFSMPTSTYACSNVVSFFQTVSIFHIICACFDTMYSSSQA